MIESIIFLTLSFLLDGLISKYIGFNIVNPSYFKTIYSIIALVILHQHFDNKKKYLSLLIIIGLLFDIIYTNSFLLNIIIFICIYFYLEWIDYIVPNNIITINIKSYIAISIYHILSYIILLFVNYNEYTINLLGIILIRSIIMTIIYTTITYYIIKKIMNKKYYNRIK